MEYDFDTPIPRQGTGSLKWDKFHQEGLLPMWVADMDFRSPPEVIEAMHQHVDHGVFGYAVATKELNETVPAMLAEKYGWTIDPAWLVWLPGLVPALNATCRAVGEPGDAVAVPTPVYPPFISSAKLAGREALSIPLVQDGSRWDLDLDQLKAALTPRTRLLLLCNPHNPVGRVYSRAQLEALAQLCAERDIIICSDEIHCELILDDLPHVPTAMLSPEIGARTITLMAASKTYNLAGLSCAFAVIPDARLRARFSRAAYGFVGEVSTLGYTATLAAYRHGEPWRRALLDYLRGNRDRVESFFAEHLPMLPVNHIEATYLAWIDVRQSGLANPFTFFRDAGVLMSDGAPFAGDGFLRLNFGCARSVLDQALERIKQAMEGSP